MRTSNGGSLAVLRMTMLLGALTIPSTTQAQRETPPAPGTPKDIKLPPKRSFALDNGLRVTLVPFGTIPMAAIQLNILAGSINETADEIWLSTVVGEMLKEGTPSRSAEQMASEAASMGGSVSVGAGADQSTIGSEVLSERTADMLRLIADVVLHPKFPESELARIKANLLRQVAIQKTVPQSIADEKFQQALFGDHPYGRVFPKDGQLNGYTIAQVRRFYDVNFGAQRGHLIVVGVYDGPAVERAIREAFSGWSRGAPAASIDVPPGPTTRSVTLLDRPDAPQSTLAMGLRIMPPASADYIPLRVTDRLLGGSFGSRITKNIREDKGYTYSPFSFTSARQRSTLWAENADVTTKDTGASLKEIFGEIDKLQKEAPPRDEVRRIQNEMVGIFALQTSSRGGIVGRLTFADLHGVGDAYLTNFVKNIMAVTPEQIRQMTVTYLRPEKMTLIVVGDKKTVEPQLAPWATVVP